MKKITDLFEKYKKTLRPPQASVEKESISVIADIANITLESTQVTYSPASRLLTLQTPSVVRSEILKNKEAILKQLSQNLGNQNCPTELR